MKKVRVSEGQNLLDLAVQLLGGMEGALLLASLNGLSLTATLEPGQELLVNESLPIRKEVAAEIGRRGLVINNSIPVPPSGVGFQIITSTAASKIDASTWIVSEGQSLLDLAVQLYGSLEGAILLASQNELSLTALLEPGQVLQVSPEKLRPELVLEFTRLGLVINNSRAVAPAAAPGTQKGFDYTFDFELS